MNKPGKSRLSESEWAIMKVFWEEGSMALGDLVEKLKDDHGWTYNTIKTLVRRMAAKGWLNVRRVGGSFLYSPAMERAKAEKQALKDFSNRVLGGILSPMIAFLSQENTLSEEDVDELEQLLDQYRKRKGRK
jgi:BlaI family transcriptional regulator, penicillinase repressor